MNDIVKAIEPIFTALLDKADAAGIAVPEEESVDKITAALLPVATPNVVNRMARTIDPEFKLSGKGITTESKLRYVLQYLFDQHQLDVEQSDEELAAHFKELPTEDEAKIQAEEAAKKKAEEAAAKKQAEQEKKKQMAEAEAKEKQRRIAKVVAFINQRANMEIATIHTPLDVLQDMYTRIKDMPVPTPTFTQDQLDQAVQSGYQAGVEEAVSRVEQAPVLELPKEEKPLIDVVAIYDALDKEVKELADKATKAIKEGNKSLYDSLTKQRQKLMNKMEELGAKHKDKIWSAERTQAFISKTRQSLADGLRDGAEVTNKYGHVGVDGLMNLANQVLNGVVAVAQTTINVTGQVGHAAVDTVSGTLNAAADLVEPKKN